MDTGSISPSEKPKQGPKPAEISPEVQDDTEAKKALVREALEDIKGSLEFSPESKQEPRQYMMFSPARMPRELPSLKTDPWPYPKEKQPSPVTINKAKQLLGTAYDKVECEMEGAGTYGYSWMIVDETTWLAREGTKAIKPPTKPARTTNYGYEQQAAYAEQMEDYRLYNHLVQEGQEKLVRWFGREMFVDLHEEGTLPVTTTPRAMIDHLAGTYAQAGDYRRHMEAVEEQFNSKFAKSQTIEQYFDMLQVARDDAKLLGQPYSLEQVINKAIKQFITRFGKDAVKAEHKWDRLDEKEKDTWARFKKYWKDEIKQWTIMRNAEKQAHEAVVAPQVEALAVQLNGLRDDISALQVENQSYREENSALLAREIEFRQALQAEQDYRQYSGQMGGRQYNQQQQPPFTDQMSGYERRIMDSIHGGSNRGNIFNE